MLATALGALLILTLAALSAVQWLRYRASPGMRYGPAVEELRGRGLAPGTYPGRALAGRFRRLTPDGTADVVIRPDGRLLVLFRTSVGFKGNYTGVLYAEGGLAEADRGVDSYGRPTVRLAIPGAPDPILGDQRGDQWYGVFFDLG